MLARSLQAARQFGRRIRSFEMAGSTEQEDVSVHECVGASEEQ
jgi:hypothetical protein